MNGGIDLKSRIKTSAVCSLLFLSLLFSSAFFVFSAEDGGYSYHSATAVQEIYADDFLSEYVGISDLSDAEREYLKLQSGFVLSYNSHIPTSYVSTSYENGRLLVVAKDYTYTASNGTTVVWTPISATVYDKTAAFSAKPYTAEFLGISASDGDKVKVEYKTEFTVSEDTVNRLLNLSYKDAPRLEAEVKEKKEAYERENAEYLINSEKYNEYLTSLSLYNAYLFEKRIYDEKYAEYQDYISRLEQYQNDIAAYNEYVAAKDKYYQELAEYTKYLSYAELNSAKIEAYEKYRDKFDTVQLQLGIIKATKTAVTSLKRTVYSAIMGDTVTAVIDKKGDIVEVLNADAAVVDMAGVATENLRILLKDFFAIPDGDTEAQYHYYVTNYEGFRDNFINLLVALDNLYLTPGVRGAMIAEEKHEKYLILVAELYHIANALSDKPIKSYDGKYHFDSDYEIGMTYPKDKRTGISSALENESFISDTDNATPLTDGYPIEPDVPEYRFMEEPTMPKPVPCPIELTPVSEPTEPTLVQKPEPVNNPGKKPREYIVPAEISLIIEEYNAGRINERQEYTEGHIVISPETVVLKTFFGAEQVTVTYYSNEFDSTEKQDVLYSVTIEKNTYADYLGEPPVKLEDSEFIYTHSGWTDENGKDVNLLCVSENLKLYPKFSATQKEYETKWIVNGTEYYENPGIPKLPENGEIYYDFSYWERTQDPVTSDVVYTAVFDTPLVLTDKGVTRVCYKDGYYVAMPESVSNRFDIGRLLARAAGAAGIKIRTLRGEELTISYAEVLKMRGEGVRYISFSSVRNPDGYAFELTACGEGGEALFSDAKITFETVYEVSDLSHFVVYYYDGAGDKLPIRYSYKERKLAFSAAPNKTYYAGVEYTLTAVPLDTVNISVSKSIAGKDELVSVSLDYLPGIRIDRIYVMNSKGEKTAVEGGYFSMPADDITVGVDYTVEQYTVTFTSDGKTIVKYISSYGDTVKPPPPPRKAPNEKFSYEFVGWSPEVSVVRGNTVYTAVYSSTLLPKAENDNMQISRGVLKLLLLFTVGVSCFAFIAVPSLTMTLVLVKKRKKYFNN